MDKKTLLSAILLIAVSSSSVAIDGDPKLLQVHPKLRLASPVQGVPDKAFEKFQIVTDEVVKSFEDKYNLLIQDLTEAKLNGLIWHSFPDHRIVRFGNTSIREGQILPMWLASDGNDFLVSEIGLDYIRITHIPNQAEFDIKLATRKTYEHILAEVRPNRKTQKTQDSINGSGKVIKAESSNSTPVNGIFPKIKTFSRHAVEARREKEDQLFLLEDDK